MAEGTDDEDKTEEPTQRRLDQAIERGDVANSVEINTFLILGAFTLGLLLAAGPISQAMTASLRGFLAHLHDVPADARGFQDAGLRAGIVWMKALAIPAGLSIVAAIAAGLLQHPIVFSAQSLGLKFERVSPMAGAKRLLGPQAFVQFGKGLAKVGIVGVVVGTILWNDRDRLEVFARLDLAACLPAVLGIAVKLMGGVLAIFLVITLADAFYQRHTWRKRLRMSKEEMKQEHKESEGSPEVKGRMKQIRASRVRKRMMAAVPTATVIVTNPTHYAVALRYEAGMEAPICVAKGVDSLALRIRAIAANHDVPVLENPPLARALHATVDIDEPIPPEHYKAVAEVIGFVMRMRRRAA